MGKPVHPTAHLPSPFTRIHVESGNGNEAHLVSKNWDLSRPTELLVSFHRLSIPMYGVLEASPSYTPVYSTYHSSIIYTGRARLLDNFLSKRAPDYRFDRALE